MQAPNAAGIISRAGLHSVDETVAKLRTLLQQRGITLFAMVDHTGEAAKAGMRMPPTKLLIFGNPQGGTPVMLAAPSELRVGHPALTQGGTPVMLAAPSSAIDLPLKLLVWEDSDGKTWLSYNDPKYLESRHGLPAGLVQNLGIAGVLAEQAAQ